MFCTCGTHSIQFVVQNPFRNVKMRREKIPSLLYNTNVRMRIILLFSSCLPLREYIKKLFKVIHTHKPHVSNCKIFVEMLITKYRYRRPCTAANIDGIYEKNRIVINGQRCRGSNQKYCLFIQCHGIHRIAMAATFFRLSNNVAFSRGDLYKKNRFLNTSG